MGEVITAKDKEYEAEERKSAPGDNQSMSDRVNNRSLRPQSPAFKRFHEVRLGRRRPGNQAARILQVHSRPP